MLIALSLLATATPSFPEQVPGLTEACLRHAVANDEVSETQDSHKYICSGAPAQQLWDWLAAAKVESWEQDAGPDGHWLSRSFPLGGCFRKVRNVDGSAATSGLSCTIWIPRSAAGAAAPR